MDTSKHFLQALSATSLSNAERAVSLLWWHSLNGTGVGITAAQLCAEIEAAGYPTQNQTRIAGSLRADRRVRKLGAGFAIRVTAADALEATYGEFAKVRRVKESDSVVPLGLFRGTRPYIEAVARQINASFDSGLYDCCAVMCRRLLETLIIEVYESKGWEARLKRDNHYMMFSGLLAVVEQDTNLHLGRSTLPSLRAFKKLGDLSAHSRRFIARRTDIVPLRDDIRVAAEDLLHIAGLVK